MCLPTPGEGKKSRDHAEAARALGLEPAGFKSTVHRLKQRFRQLLRTEIAATLSGPTSVDE